MNQTQPGWLNKTFLLSSLQGNNPNAPKITINSYSVEQGVAPGNNYGSVIIRVKVEYKEGDSDQSKSVSLIVKAPLANNAVEMLSELFGLAEYSFYYLFLPKMSEIMKTQIAAKTYYTSMKSVIVLEDLIVSGFSMADRHKQLDFNHCKQYFVASGKLHAAGVLIAKLNPELREALPSVLDKMTVTGDNSHMKLFLHDMIVGLKCLVKSIEPKANEECKSYLETIKKFITFSTISSLSEDGQKALTQTQKDLNNRLFKSFIHGDCWTTNMMFKHNKAGVPVDIRLIDFQAFRYDTVIYDVINFTWMSADNDVLKDHLEELYNIYCDTLNTTLIELGCSERLSFQQLKEEISQLYMSVLTMVGVYLPLTLADELIDTGKMFTGKITEDDIMVYYQGERFWNKFPHVLKCVAMQGVFESMENSFTQWEQVNS